MKNLILAILAAVALSSCTVLDPMHTQLSAEFDLESMTEMEVLHLVNNEPGYCNRFDFMEGYVQPDLVELYKAGRLTMHQMNPLWVASGLFGWADPRPGMYGDIHSCEAHYTNKAALAHELQHCMGCTDRPDLFDPMMYAYRQTYTPEQMEIMMQEKVTRWIDTSYYKNEDATYHLPKGVLHP